MLLLFCAIMNTWLSCSWSGACSCSGACCCPGSCCCSSCGMYLPTSNTLVYSPPVASKASRAASVWCWWYRISSSGSASEKSKKTLTFCIGQISVQGPPDHSQDKILSVTAKYQLRNTTGRWTICGQVFGAPVKSHLSSHKRKTWYFCLQLRNTVNMEL